MIKKIFLTIVAVLVAGAALSIYGMYMAADDVIKTSEPQLREYVQMDEPAQNKYVLDHADELLAQAALETDDPEDKQTLNLWSEIKNDPAVQKATTELGRAILAAAVLHSEAIVKDMNAQLKAKFEQEKSELTDRLAKYSDVVDAAEKALKNR